MMRGGIAFVLVAVMFLFASLHFREGPVQPSHPRNDLVITPASDSPQAMFLLANAYRTGAGVARDEGKALTLYMRAGGQEHAASLQAIALAHRFGELGLVPDELEYRRYMSQAEHALEHRTSARPKAD